MGVGSGRGACRECHGGWEAGQGRVRDKTKEGGGKSPARGEKQRTKKDVLTSSLRKKLARRAAKAARPSARTGSTWLESAERVAKAPVAVATLPDTRAANKSPRLQGKQMLVSNEKTRPFKKAGFDLSHEIYR